MSKCENCKSEVTKQMGGVFLSGLKGNKMKYLCNRCFNEYIAKDSGIDFQHLEFKNVNIMDVDGNMHEFFFVYQIVPTGIAIYANEKKENPDDEYYAYKFSILGDLEEEPSLLYYNLVKKIQKCLSEKFITIENNKLLGPINRLISLRIAGRIGDSEDGGDDKMFIIDGKPYSSGELLQILKIYEGFQFKLEIIDETDEASFVEVKN